MKKGVKIGLIVGGILVLSAVTYFIGKNQGWFGNNE